MIPGQGNLLGTILSGVGSLLGGGGAPEEPTAVRRRRLASEGAWIRQTYGVNSTEWRDFRKRHPQLAKDLLAGKWPQIYNPRTAPAGSPGTRPLVVRPGDVPLRTVGAVLPDVGGPMRKIATGALRVAGPASWALTGALTVPWLMQGQTASPYKGGFSPRTPSRAPAPSPEPLRRSLPKAPPPAGSRPAPVVGPVGSSPSGQSAAPGNPRPATAGPPKPATVTLPAAKPKWWQTALGALSPLLSLLPKDRERGARARALVTVNPFSQAPQPSTPGLPEAPLTAPETPSAECSCPPKKPRQPRKPRSECRTGRFIERRTGIQKYQTRKTKCLPSSAKRP